MTPTAQHTAASGALSRDVSDVDELREDLDVAIEEFLERHPRTSPRRVRTALRKTERSAGGSRDGRLARALALLAAFAVGLGLGVML